VLENAKRGFCPGPVATLRIVAPDGSTFTQLQTANLPAHDCVYPFEANATLSPGVWRIEYEGGSDALGSVVDVRNAS
jgi:hypothetical protein